MVIIGIDYVDHRCGLSFVGHCVDYRRWQCWPWTLTALMAFTDSVSAHTLQASSACHSPVHSGKHSHCYTRCRWAAVDVDGGTRSNGHGRGATRAARLCSRTWLWSHARWANATRWDAGWNACLRLQHVKGCNSCSSSLSAGLAESAGKVSRDATRLWCGAQGTALSTPWERRRGDRNVGNRKPRQEGAWFFFFSCASVVRLAARKGRAGFFFFR